MGQTARVAAGAAMALLVLVGPVSAGNVAHQDFDAPAKARSGAVVAPAGLEIRGDAKRVTRFAGPGRHQRAVAFSRSARLVQRVPVPELPKVEGLDRDGWYGVACVDVLGATAASGATLTLGCTVQGRDRPAAKATMAVDWKASPHRAKRPASARRLWARIPGRVLRQQEKRELVLELSVEGRPRVVVDDLRIDLFHEQPSRKLLGKPNGQNGPDLLAAGALGFVALAEHEACAFSLLSVAEDGPAHKAGLRAGDLIVAIEGEPLPPGSLAAGKAWFETGHEAVLGRTLLARLEGGQKELHLTRLTAQGPEERTLRIGHLGALGERFPEGKAADQLAADATSWVAKRQKQDGFWPGQRVVNSCLAGLCLLGTRDRAHRPAIRRLVKALLDLHPRARDARGFSFWPIAWQGIFFAEYYLASHDKRVLTWMRDAIDWLPSTTHPSTWEIPAFGHSPKGLPYGDKALMAPCSHLLVFEALAERCGIDGGIWDHLAPYVKRSWSDPDEGGHGGMGYNPAHKDKHEFWSRTGLTALALHLRGKEPRMRKAMAAFMVERHPWMLNSHAYGEPGGALGLMALAAMEPKAFAEILAAWRWRFLLAWEPGYGLRYSTPHMGAPYMGEDEILNPAYGAVFSARRGGLVMTGGKARRWLR